MDVFTSVEIKEEIIEDEVGGEAECDEEKELLPSVKEEIIQGAESTETASELMPVSFEQIKVEKEGRAVGIKRKREALFSDAESETPTNATVKEEVVDGDQTKCEEGLNTSSIEIKNEFPNDEISTQPNTADTVEEIDPETDAQNGVIEETEESILAWFETVYLASSPLNIEKQSEEKEVAAEEEEDDKLVVDCESGSKSEEEVLSSTVDNQVKKVVSEVQFSRNETCRQGKTSESKEVETDTASSRPGCLNTSVIANSCVTPKASTEGIISKFAHPKSTKPHSTPPCTSKHFQKHSKPSIKSSKTTIDSSHSYKSKKKKKTTSLSSVTSSKTPQTLPKPKAIFPPSSYISDSPSLSTSMTPSSKTQCSSFSAEGVLTPCNSASKTLTPSVTPTSSKNSINNSVKTSTKSVSGTSATSTSSKSDCSLKKFKITKTSSTSVTTSSNKPISPKIIPKTCPAFKTHQSTNPTSIPIASKNTARSVYYNGDHDYDDVTIDCDQPNSKRCSRHKVTSITSETPGSSRTSETKHSTQSESEVASCTLSPTSDIPETHMSLGTCTFRNTFSDRIKIYSGYSPSISPITRNSSFIKLMTLSDKQTLNTFSSRPNLPTSTVTSVTSTSTTNMASGSSSVLSANPVNMTLRSDLPKIKRKKSRGIKHRIRSERRNQLHRMLASVPERPNDNCTGKVREQQRHVDANQNLSDEIRSNYAGDFSLDSNNRISLNDPNNVHSNRSNETLSLHSNNVLQNSHCGFPPNGPDRFPSSDSGKFSLNHPNYSLENNSYQNSASQNKIGGLLSNDRRRIALNYPFGGPNDLNRHVLNHHNRFSENNPRIFLLNQSNDEPINSSGVIQNNLSGYLSNDPNRFLLNYHNRIPKNDLNRCLPNDSGRYLLNQPNNIPPNNPQLIRSAGNDHSGLTLHPNMLSLNDPNGVSVNNYPYNHYRMLASNNPNFFILNQFSGSLPNGSNRFLLNQSPGAIRNNLNFYPLNQSSTLLPSSVNKPTVTHPAESSSNNFNIYPTIQPSGSRLKDPRIFQCQQSPSATLSTDVNTRNVPSPLVFPQQSLPSTSVAADPNLQPACPTALLDGPTDQSDIQPGIQSPDNYADKVSNAYPLNFRIHRITLQEIRPYDFSLRKLPYDHSKDPRTTRIRKLEVASQQTTLSPVNTPPLSTVPAPKVALPSLISNPGSSVGDPVKTKKKRKEKRHHKERLNKVIDDLQKIADRNNEPLHPLLHINTEQMSVAKCKKLVAAVNKTITAIRMSKKIQNKKIDRNLKLVY